MSTIPDTLLTDDERLLLTTIRALTPWYWYLRWENGLYEAAIFNAPDYDPAQQIERTWGNLPGDTLARCWAAVRAEHAREERDA